MTSLGQVFLGKHNLNLSSTNRKTEAQATIGPVVESSQELELWKTILIAPQHRMRQADKKNSWPRFHRPRNPR